MEKHEMTDYISRETALEAIEAHRDIMAKTDGVSNKGKALYLMGQDHAIDMLCIVPAADVIPVVRCKDCKYAHLTNDGYCKYCDKIRDDEGFTIELYKDGDYYCADGERRE